MLILTYFFQLSFEEDEDCVTFLGFPEKFWDCCSENWDSSCFDQQEKCFQRRTKTTFCDVNCYFNSHWDYCQKFDDIGFCERISMLYSDETEENFWNCCADNEDDSSCGTRILNCNKYFNMAESNSRTKFLKDNCESSCENELTKYYWCDGSDRSPFSPPCENGFSELFWQCCSINPTDSNCESKKIECELDFNRAYCKKGCQFNNQWEMCQNYSNFQGCSEYAIYQNDYDLSFWSCCKDQMNHSSCSVDIEECLRLNKLPEVEERCKKACVASPLFEWCPNEKSSQQISVSSSIPSASSSLIYSSIIDSSSSGIGAVATTVVIFFGICVLALVVFIIIYFCVIKKKLTLISNPQEKEIEAETRENLIITDTETKDSF